MKYGILITEVFAYGQVNLPDLNYLSLPETSRSSLRNPKGIWQPKTCSFLMSIHALSYSFFQYKHLFAKYSHLTSRQFRWYHFTTQQNHKLQKDSHAGRGCTDTLRVKIIYH